MATSTLWDKSWVGQYPPSIWIGMKDRRIEERISLFQFTFYFNLVNILNNMYIHYTLYVHTWCKTCVYFSVQMVQYMYVCTYVVIILVYITIKRGEESSQSKILFSFFFYKSRWSTMIYSVFLTSFLPPTRQILTTLSGSCLCSHCWWMDLKPSLWEMLPDPNTTISLQIITYVLCILCQKILNYIII